MQGFRFLEVQGLGTRIELLGLVFFGFRAGFTMRFW